MTTNNSLTFQPGKFYRTRDGRKARICARDGIIPFCLHGSIETQHGTVPTEWASSGRYTLGGDNDHDLIAEWKDAPEVDWSKMPEGTTAVFQNGREGRWFAAIRGVPTLGNFGFFGGYWVELYPQHVPKWSGDWRESLVTRPTEETK